MKILQILPDFEVAGAETMAEKLMYELRSMGNDVVAVSLYSKETDITERLKRHNIRIEFLKKRAGLDLSQIFKLYMLFKKEKPDIIHTHRYVLQYVAPAAVLTGRAKIIHTIHSIAQKENKKIARIFNRILFKAKIATPVSLSSAVQKTVVREYNLSENQAPYIYNGMPVDNYIPKKDYSFGERIIILHVGRFNSVKNHKRLIDSFENVCEKYRSAKLILAGVGPLMEETKLIVTEKGLQENVEFLGLCTDVKTLMHNADIFCLPSDYEGVPMTLIEAMATSLPIVATNVGGVPDMIQDGVEGLLCESNATSVADALVKLIEDESLREELGQAALLKAQNYSSKKMAEKYLELYKSRMKKHRGATK